MKNEEQHKEFLIPINKEAVDDYLRLKRNPWSLRGFFLRLREKRRRAQAKRLLKPLSVDQKKLSVSSRGETELEPPWITMPGYPMYSMAWRMGSGESVSLKFQMRYRDLPESAQEAFRRQYPEPEGWEGYYSRIMRGNNEHFRGRI